MSEVLIDSECLSATHTTSIITDLRSIATEVKFG